MAGSRAGLLFAPPRSGPPAGLLLERGLYRLPGWAVCPALRFLGACATGRSLTIAGLLAHAVYDPRAAVQRAGLHALARRAVRDPALSANRSWAWRVQARTVAEEWSYEPGLARMLALPASPRRRAARGREAALWAEIAVPAGQVA